jgi:hypothetical protein
MDSKALIHSILAVSTISIILVTMASVGQRVDATSAVTTTKSTARTIPPNTNDINCQSKKGTTNTETALGTLKFAGGKCTGENGGTVAAGGVKSNSGAIGIHGINGPNDNSHIGGFIKR